MDLKQQLQEKEKIENQLHEEKVYYNQRTRNSINQYIQIKFHEDISDWLNTLNEEQLFIIQDHLYIINTVEELMHLL